MSSALLVAVVACSTPGISMHGDVDAPSETPDIVTTDPISTDPAMDRGVPDIDPDFVATACSEIWGDDGYPVVGMHMPWQDSFCAGREDCWISPGPDSPMPCPNECVCICYNEMAFMGACTLLPGCDEDSEICM